MKKRGDLKMSVIYEDKVRDLAGKVLGFDVPEEGREIEQGVGQIKTFNQLGFKGVNDRPDGWYLPKNTKDVAIIAEFKSSDKDLSSKAWEDELLKNIKIVLTKYDNCVGILHNGVDTRVFINYEERLTVSKQIEHKMYYIRLVDDQPIDKGRIYTVTKQINDDLHFEFGMKDLYSRMIFTACALVATRYGATLVSGMTYEVLKLIIKQTIEREMNGNTRENDKLVVLLDVYEGISINQTPSQGTLDLFVSNVTEISSLVNSSQWNGEDVMGIFFNEFSRYKGKSESGQVFTPDHITSLMVRLLEVTEDDKILDSASGSGAFLVKAMSVMIEKAGGVDTQKAREIKKNQLFGVEYDKQVFALACANFLIHKDGKTNLYLGDSRLESTNEWIRQHNITKVLMNPPYERKYGSMTIVENAMDSVPKGTPCAFILPDKHLEKHASKTLLKKHRLTTIIRLDKDTFYGVGVTTSIFIFTAGVPQDGNEIFACYIEEDGLVTVKNQGRQDVYDKWQEKEDAWLNIIRRRSGSDTIQWLDPKKHLSWQEPQESFEIFEEDFIKTLLEYECFQRGIDPKELGKDIIETVLYNSTITETDESINISVNKGGI